MMFVAHKCFDIQIMNMEKSFYMKKLSYTVLWPKQLSEQSYSFWDTLYIGIKVIFVITFSFILKMWSTCV